MVSKKQAQYYAARAIASDDEERAENAQEAALQVQHEYREKKRKQLELAATLHADGKPVFQVIIGVLGDEQRRLSTDPHGDIERTIRALYTEN